jgi:hypothetical protein
MKPAEPVVLVSDPRLLLGDRQQEALLFTNDLCEVFALVRPLGGLPWNVFLAGKS